MQLTKILANNTARNAFPNGLVVLHRRILYPTFIDGFLLHNDVYREHCSFDLAVSFHSD